MNTYTKFAIVALLAGTVCQMNALTTYALSALDTGMKCLATQNGFVLGTQLPYGCKQKQMGQLTPYIQCAEGENCTACYSVAHDTWTGIYPVDQLVDCQKKVAMIDMNNGMPVEASAVQSDSF